MKESREYYAREKKIPSLLSIAGGACVDRGKGKEATIVGKRIAVF